MSEMTSRTNPNEEAVTRECVVAQPTAALHEKVAQDLERRRSAQPGAAASAQPGAAASAQPGAVPSAQDLADRWG